MGKKSCKCSGGRVVHNCTKYSCKYCCDEGKPLDNKSVLGGIVAPQNSAYVMRGMSNPKLERPIKPLDNKRPSQYYIGNTANMENFNPYGNQYRSHKTGNKRNALDFGGQKESPMLAKSGGYQQPTAQPIGENKKCGDKTCKMKIKSGGLFGGGLSIFGIGVKKGKMNVPCVHSSVSNMCVCQGTQTAC